MNRASLALAVPLAVALQSVAAPPVTIPFELANRHVIVKARVNDSRPLSFILDTGANVAIVRMATAKELGLSLHGDVKTGGAGAGTQAGQRVKDAKWSLVGFDGFSQPVTMALPFEALPSGLGQDVDGIIGGEFIRQFVLTLDYQARTITLHEPNTFKYAGNGQTLPLEFTPAGHPVVKAVVTPVGGQPIEHRFMLDIGSGLALALHSPFAAEHNLPGPQSRTISAIGMAGAGGRSVGRLGRVSALQIGTFTIANPITLFSEDTAGAFANRSLAGNIGAQIASRFRTILDYGRRRIILEPSPAFADPFDRAFSGMAVRAEGADYRTFRVKEVLEDSPATEAGIQQGDVITSIDGIAAANLTLTGIIQILEEPVAREMTIRRGEQTIKVTVTPKRLV
jgi:PDZ domain/Aspartyl protease